MDAIKEKASSVIGGLSTTDQLLALGIIAAVVIMLVLLVYVNHLKKQTKVEKERKKRQKESYLEALYYVFSKNRFTKGYVRRLTKRFSLMSIFQRDEIHRGVARYTKQLFLYTMAAIVISCFVFEDVMSVLISVLLVYVWFSVKIEMNLQNSIVRVLYELKYAVSSIRLEYKKTLDVILALENGTYGRHIAPIMEDLKSVLTNAKGEEALTEFYEKVPFKQVQTLAMVCYNINNTGDEIDEHNNSVFDEAMLVMNSDINQKIEEYNYERVRFGKIEYLSLVGIAMCIILKYLVSAMLPSAAIVYHSAAGLLIQYGCMLYSIYAYYVVAHGHIRAIMKSDDRKAFIVRLLNHRPVNKFISTMMPKNRDRRIWEAKLKRAFSKMSLKEFWCERYAWGAGIFLFLFVATISAPFVQRTYLENYTGSFDIAGYIDYDDDDGNRIWTDEYILELDDRYMKLRDQGKWESLGTDNVLDQEVQEIYTMISEHLKDNRHPLTELELMDQQNRLEEKYQRLKEAKYHWYYVLLPILGAIIGYLVPVRALKKRTELAANEEEEEFLQLQIVMMILASMNFDTLETLGHLAQIADIHKEMLLYCYYGYASDPVGELDKMMKTTQSENFKYFISKLKTTVEDLSIKEAFEDLQSDREHICNERAVYIKESINRKRARLGQTALRPMQFATFGMLVFPLVYTGLTGLLSAFNKIQTI